MHPSRAALGNGELGEGVTGYAEFALWFRDELRKLVISWDLEILLSHHTEVAANFPSTQLKFLDERIWIHGRSVVCHTYHHFYLILSRGDASLLAGLVNDRIDLISLNLLRGSDVKSVFSSHQVFLGYTLAAVTNNSNPLADLRRLANDEHTRVQYSLGEQVM